MNDLSPQVPPDTSNKPDGTSGRGSAKRKSKGESHASVTQLEERFRSNRDKFLAAMEALYPVAKRLKDDAAKTPLLEASEVTRLANQLERSYSGLADAREMLDQRKTSQLIRGQQNLLAYIFANLNEQQLKLANKMMADGTDPSEILAAISAQGAPSGQSALGPVTSPATPAAAPAVQTESTNVPPAQSGMAAPKKGFLSRG